MTNDEHSGGAGADPPPSESTAPNLCPLTLRPLPAAPLDVGHIYNIPAPPYGGSEGACGHRCALLPLVRYAQERGGGGGGGVGGGASDPSASGAAGAESAAAARGPPRNGGGLTCPVCLESPVVSICDGVTASALSARGSVGGGECSVVAFKYGKQTFWLGVPRGGGGLLKKASTAQDRIAHVLGMDVHRGLKLLHKGKVLHPDQSCAPQEVSERLLAISRSDVEKRKKPSLVAMGTRSSMGIREAGIGGLFRHGFVGVFYWGFTIIFQKALGILGGLVLFVKTILYLPDADRRED